MAFAAALPAIKALAPSVLGAGAGFLGGMFGGGGDDDEQSPPTLLESLAQFPEAAQLLFGTTQQIAPQQAQLQLDLLKQFGLPIAQQQQDIARELQPFTVDLQEALAKQATEGLTAGLTAQEQRIINDAIRSNLGEQAVSPLGTQRLGSELLNQTRQRQQGAQQLGFALTSRQPLFQGQVPQFTQFESGLTPGMALNQASTSFSQLPVDEGFGPLLSGLGSIAGQFAGSKAGSELISSGIGKLFS
jgi:hypothetical protein